MTPLLNGVVTQDFLIHMLEALLHSLMCVVTFPVLHPCVAGPLGFLSQLSERLATHADAPFFPEVGSDDSLRPGRHLGRRAIRRTLWLSNHPTVCVVMTKPSYPTKPILSLRPPKEMVPVLLPTLQFSARSPVHPTVTASLVLQASGRL